MIVHISLYVTKKNAKNQHLIIVPKWSDVRGLSQDAYCSWVLPLTYKPDLLGKALVAAFDKAEELKSSGLFVEAPQRLPEWSRITGIKVKSRFINKYMAIDGVLYRNEIGRVYSSGKRLYEHVYGSDTVGEVKLLRCVDDSGVGNFYAFELFHRLRARIVYYGVRPGAPQFTHFLPLSTTSPEVLGRSVLEMIQEIYDKGFD